VIGEGAKLQNFKILSSKIGEVMKEQKNYENLGISRVWVVVDKKQLVQ
jgi:hypothetical protein